MLSFFVGATERLGLAPNRRGLDRLADVAVDLGELFLRKNADEDGGRFVHTLPCECGLRPKRLSGFGTARMGPHQALSRACKHKAGAG